MSTPETRVPDLVLDRYVAGDLPPRARAKLEQQLASSPALRARVAALRAEREAFLSADPPERFAHRVAAKVATERRTGPRVLAWLAPAGAAAVGVVAVAFALRHGDERPGSPTSWREEPAATAEGSAPAAGIVARRDGAPAADRPTADRSSGSETAASRRREQAAASSEAPPRAPAGLAAGRRPEREAPPREQLHIVGSRVTRKASPAPQPPAPTATAPAAGAGAPQPGPAPSASAGAGAADRREGLPPEQARRKIAPLRADEAPAAEPHLAPSAPPEPPALAERRAARVGERAPGYSDVAGPENIAPSLAGPDLRTEAAPSAPELTVSTRGALDQGRARIVVRAALPRLLEARRAAGVTTGLLTATCDVEAGGRVTAARVISPALPEASARPIVAALRALRFSPASAPGPTIVTITLPAP